jgi:hypothetical protein
LLCQQCTSNSTWTIRFAVRRTERITDAGRFSPVRRVAVAVVLAAAATGAGGSQPAAAQDSNVGLAVAEAEALLGHAPFEVVEFRTLRPGGRSRLAALRFDSTPAVWAKWAAAPRGGAADNAQPRFEVGAYRLQKLFLDEPEYVVPPTLARVVSLEDYPDGGRGVRATFPEAPAVLVVLQLWLQEVSSQSSWDERRFRTDSVYARHVANLNVLTYLIRHGDSNTGNFLISRDSANPRVFSVDNGIAFGALPNPDAHEWLAAAGESPAPRHGGAPATDRHAGTGAGARRGNPAGTARRQAADGRAGTEH